MSGLRGALLLLAAWALAATVVAAESVTPKAPPPPGWLDAPLPDGPVGAAIAQGRRILGNAPKYAAEYSGNALTCTNCHLDGGRTRHAAPWVGIWGVFPEYRPRNAKVNTLADRVNDCFERSLNGKRLPLDSPEMTAILTYMQWLSREVPTGESVPGRGFLRIEPPEPPSPERGLALYGRECASCHGKDGGGRGATGTAEFVPPLWGPKSYNLGAGLARLSNAAAFIKANMPQGKAGSLSDQDAYDIAAYFTRQPRPDFARKAEDWPQGGKPKDARY